MTRLAPPTVSTPQVEYTGLGWVGEGDEHVFLVRPGELLKGTIEPNAHVGWLPCSLPNSAKRQAQDCGMSLLSMFRDLGLDVGATPVFRSTEPCSVEALMHAEARMTRDVQIGEGPLKFDADLVFPVGRLCGADAGLGTGRTPKWLRERFDTDRLDLLLGDDTQTVADRVIFVLRELGPFFPAHQAKLFVAQQLPLQVIVHYLTTGERTLSDEALSRVIPIEEPTHLWREPGESLFRLDPRSLRQ